MSLDARPVAAADRRASLSRAEVYDRIEGIAQRVRVHGASVAEIELAWRAMMDLATLNGWSAADLGLGPPPSATVIRLAPPVGPGGPREAGVGDRGGGRNAAPVAKRNRRPHPFGSSSAYTAAIEGTEFK